MRQIVLSILFSCFSLFLLHPEASAQKKDKYTFTYRMNLRLFGGVAFQNGSSYSEMFKTERMGNYGSLFLGYRFDEESKKANYFGIFGTIYSVKPESLSIMNTDGAIKLSAPSPTGRTNGFNVEGGFIFSDWFRISAGYGNLGLPTGNNPDAISYFSGTGGIILGKGGFNIHLTTTALFGGDLEKSCFRTNAGVGLNFKFLKGRKAASNN
jgi:hypothetical protein